MGLTVVTSLLSAAVLYAASPHCRLPLLGRLRQFGAALGAALAIVSLSLWIVCFGGGAGLSAMLGTWMLALIGFPYLAWLIAGLPADDAVSRESD